MSEASYLETRRHSIAQNTVLAQDVWLEENDILSNIDSYGINTLTPCSKPEPNIKGDNTLLVRAQTMLGCQTHTAVIDWLANSG